MLISAMFLCQMLNASIIEDDLDFDTRLWLFKLYGTPARAIYTMFEITFSGCFPNYTRRVIEEVNVFFAAFVIAYVAGVVFAVTRIITALLLKDTFQAAANDHEMMIEQKIQEKNRFLAQLYAIFCEADKSGDGVLSLEEFQQILSKPKVLVLFHLLELDVHHISGLFALLDDGDGVITYEEFESGIMRLKGHSRSLDTIKISNECERLSDMCTSLQLTLDRLSQKL